MEQTVVEGKEQEIQPCTEPCGSGEVVIVVKTLAIGQFTITIDRSATINDLKERIWSVTELEPSRFHLGYNGVLLNEGNKGLTEVGLGHESIVHIFVKQLSNLGVKVQEGQITSSPTYKDITAGPTNEQVMA